MENSLELKRYTLRGRKAATAPAASGLRLRPPAREKGEGRKRTKGNSRKENVSANVHRQFGAKEQARSEQRRPLSVSSISTLWLHLSEPPDPRSRRSVGQLDLTGTWLASSSSSFHSYVLHPYETPKALLCAIKHCSILAALLDVPDTRNYLISEMAERGRAAASLERPAVGASPHAAHTYCTLARLVVLARFASGLRPALPSSQNLI